MTIPNIGLISKLRGGKDTVADYLVANYGYTRFAFGDELKSDFHKRYPEIPRDPKPRAGYQFHGQLMREHLGENVWIDACFERIADREIAVDYWAECYGHQPLRAVISDCRQLNEARRLQSEGYVLIRVTCPDAIRIDRAIKSGDRFEYADLMHGTETELDEWSADYTIANDGSLAELYAKVDAVMVALREGGEVA